jgi:hypothetical protein
MLARLPALFLLWVPAATTAAEDADRVARSIDLSCQFFGDVEIPRIIEELQRVSDLLPAIPPAEKKAQDEKAGIYFREGDIPPSQRLPGMDADLNRLGNVMSQWRYAYLARALNSLKSAQAAVGYILLDPKASREYEDAGHLVASPGEHHAGYKNPEAEKLYRTTFAVSYLSSAEADLKAFLANEELRGNDTLLSEDQRNELQRYGGGVVGVMANYIRCKLVNVVAAKTPSGLPRN